MVIDSREMMKQARKNLLWHLMRSASRYLYVREPDVLPEVPLIFMRE